MAFMAPVMAWMAANAGTIAAVTSAASAGMAAYGGYKQGEQMASTQKWNASVARANAAAAKEKAAAEEAQTRERYGRVMATQRTLYGASGVDMGGTPLLVMEEQAKQAEIDALTIRYGGNLLSTRNLNEAESLTQQAGATQSAAGIGVGSTLLTGASNIFTGAMRGRLPRSPYYYDADPYSRQGA